MPSLEPPVFVPLPARKRFSQRMERTKRVIKRVLDTLAFAAGIALFLAIAQTIELFDGDSQGVMRSVSLLIMSVMVSTLFGYLAKEVFRDTILESVYRRYRQRQFDLFCEAHTGQSDK